MRFDDSNSVSFNIEVDVSDNLGKRLVNLDI